MNLYKIKMEKKKKKKKNVWARGFFNYIVQLLFLKSSTNESFSSSGTSPSIRAWGWRGAGGQVVVGA